MEMRHVLVQLPLAAVLRGFRVAAALNPLRHSDPPCSHCATAFDTAAPERLKDSTGLLENCVFPPRGSFGDVSAGVEEGYRRSSLFVQLFLRRCGFPMFIALPVLTATLLEVAESGSFSTTLIRLLSFASRCETEAREFLGYRESWVSLILYRLVWLFGPRACINECFPYYPVPVALNRGI